MDIEAIINNLPLYLEGLVTTVQLVALSLAPGFIVGGTDRLACKQ